MSETTVVHVMRHGEVHNPDKILYGRLPGYRLSTDGEAMAEKAAAWFAGRDITHLVASPLERAQQTAQPIARTLELEVHTDDCRDQAQGDAPPLLHIVSGAAGKQRPEHSAFMAWQEREHPGFRPLYVRSLVWGFGELVLEGNGAHVLMVTTPWDGSGGTAVEFDARFERRSGVLRGQAD